MPRRRPKDFEREIPKVSRVAGSKNAPEQLNLDELLPDHAHGWNGTQGTDYGYVSRCLCGWQSREMVSRPDAHIELRRHLARTPQGGIVVRNLRKFGRGGSGA